MTFVQEAQFSLLGEWRMSPQWPKICSFHHQQKFPPQQIPLIKAVIFGPVPSLFLTSYSLYTQVLQILIFIVIQYIFTKCCVQLRKKVRIVKITFPQIPTTGLEFPHPPMLFGKPKQNAICSKNMLPKTYLCPSVQNRP